MNYSVVFLNIEFLFDFYYVMKIKSFWFLGKKYANCE